MSSVREKTSDAYRVLVLRERDGWRVREGAGRGVRKRDRMKGKGSERYPTTNTGGTEEADGHRCTGGRIKTAIEPIISPSRLRPPYGPLVAVVSLRRVQLELSV